MLDDERKLKAEVKVSAPHLIGISLRNRACPCPKRKGDLGEIKLLMASVIQFNGTRR
jgi:hypothetical protein